MLLTSQFRNYYPPLVTLLFAFFIVAYSSLNAQVGFSVDDVVTNLSSPTSLDFGPDGRLYVAQQNGTITVYRVSRLGLGDYQVDSSETLLNVKHNVPNHDDDGAFNSSLKRQITGIMTAGSDTNPILYVASSDWRIKVGEDGNLDTNSGTITRLTWVGSDIDDPNGYWDQVDIVRGLPRSEENHATNGMDLDETNNILYVMNGGNCNKGVPSNNFGATPEYALSAALLTIDLDSIENMPIFTDSRTNTKFIYDLPTLDDPTRINIDNTHPDFPYPSNHPMYNSFIDWGDPFGGNNGLNQAMWVESGPVQVYSPGYRNAYDVVFTSLGRLYTFDNGPNGGWGGPPLIYDSLGNTKGTGPWTPGDYSTNELQESASTAHGDGLHYISSPGYYGGYPNPTRANPDQADLFVYDYINGGWVLDSVYDFMTDFPEPPVPLSLANPIESDYQAPAAALTVINSSTNGIAEYTASNFNGALQGNLLAVAFNDNVYSIELNGSGDALVQQDILLNGFGNNPLDVIALGDSGLFPGTIWVALHGSNKITVFEPNDYEPFTCDSTYSTMIDSDGDGYLNADELDNGTDPCSQGSKPDDYDGDFVSNLNDTDDDNDGLLDTYDPFPVDSANGLSTFLPINYGFSINGNDAVPGSLFGLGFTGVMTNGDPVNATPGADYQMLYNEDSLNLGGATSKLGIENIGFGDASGGLNTQENGFQFGLNIDTTSAPFTVVTRVESPFFLVNGAPIQPINGQSMGLMAGPGNQDNYVKVVMNAQGGASGVGVSLEINGIETTTDYDTTITGDVLGVTAVDLFLTFDPGNLTVQPAVSTDGGATRVNLGAPLSIPADWFDLSDGLGFATGVISTSGNSGQKFDATWDFINVLSSIPAALGLPDVQVVAGDPDDQILLNNYFDDDGGANNLTYSITSNTGTSTVAQISGSTLSLIYPSSGSDMADIIVRATDANGQFVEDTFNVVVIDALTVYYRVNTGGNFQTTLDAPKPNWDEDTQFNASSYRNGGSKANGYNITNTDASVPATTPLAVFQSERWDPKSGGQMEWDFPVLDPGNYEIRLYFANGFSGTNTPGKRIFSVEVEGDMVLTDYDIVADVGHQVGTMKSFVKNVTDGNIDINFIQGSNSTPIINAIEIIGSTGAVSTKSLLASQNAIHFFSTEVDSASNPALDTLSNGGNSTLTVSTINLTGTDAAMFSHNLSVPFTIDGGNIHPFEVIFSPTSIGSKSASLELVHDGDNGSPLVIALTGEAISSVNQPPVSALGDQTDSVNSVVNIAGSSYASDPEGDNMTFSATGLAAIGLSINSTNGDITGTLISSAGDYPVSLKIVDDGIPSDSVIETFIWSITDMTGVVLYRVNNGGAQVAATDSPNQDWDEDTQTNSSPYRNGGSKVNGYGVVNLDASVPATTPLAVFQSERWDPKSGGQMEWDFPVSNIDNYEVRLYFADGYSGTNLPGKRVFSVAIEGDTLLKDFDIVAEAGHMVGMMKTFIVPVADGNLDINFIQGGKSTPLVNGIEIIGGAAGTSTKILAANISSMTLPDTKVDSSSTPAANALVNNGNTALSIGWIDITGTDAAMFSHDLSFPVTINPGDQLPFHIIFSPTSVGNQTASLEIIHDGDNMSPFVISLDGEGLPTNSAPVIALGAQNDSTNATINIIGSTYASDPDGDNLTFSATGLAALGLSIDPSSGDITGTITAGIGVYPITIQAVDDGTPADSSSENFDWTISQPQTSSQVVVYRVNTGGVLTAANDAPNSDWTEDTQTNGSPYRSAGSKTNGYNILQVDGSVPASTPLTIFQSERFDPRSGGNMEWNFPVSDSGDYEVRLYFADGYAGTNVAGKRIFSVELEGDTILPNYDVVADVGPSMGTMKAFTQTINDGNIDINFLIGAKSTPIICGIEIISLGQSTQPPMTGLWTEEFSADSSELEERRENDYIEVNGKFYLIGGRGNVGVSIYNPVAQTWTAGTAPPKQLHHFQAVSFNNKIYVTGAMTGNYPNESPVDSIYEYDPVGDAWSSITEIPLGRRRGAGGTVVYNGEFYLLSGLTNGHVSGHVPWADKYNPTTNTWTILADAPRARDHFQASVTNGKIYLAGGRLSKANDGPVFANTIGAVDVYDIATDSWTTLADSIPTKRAGSSSVVFGNHVVVIGGESDVQTIAHNEVEALDVNTGTWTSFPTLITGRHGTGSIVYNNRIYVAGGIGQQGGNPRLTSQEYYDSSTASARLANNDKDENIEVLVEESSAEEISIYPNPFNQVLHIVGELTDQQKTPVRFRLFDVRGSLVFEKSWTAIEQLELEVTIPSIPPGLYIYEIKTRQMEKKGRLIRIE